MSAKAIREYHGKKLLYKHLKELCPEYNDTKKDSSSTPNLLLITPSITDFNSFDDETFSWLRNTKLVVKPDQLVKRRGKLGLVGIDLNWKEVQEWITEKRNQTIRIDNSSYNKDDDDESKQNDNANGAAYGRLTHFIVEPMIPHKEEYYICIRSHRDGDEILFSREGGIAVGDIDKKAMKCFIPIDLCTANKDNMIQDIIRKELKLEKKDEDLISFLAPLFEIYCNLYFTYLEINPLVYDTIQKRYIPLDLAAKVDETASFLVNHWDGEITEFPTPFGCGGGGENNGDNEDNTIIGSSVDDAESYIRALDGQTGASLKLTILNPNGSIWTMVAGGGASVVYADTISDLGYGEKLANYGEYSGAPSMEHTYEYAKTVLRCLLSAQAEENKIFLIGGGIANFTDVAATFTGLIKALTHFQEELKLQKVKIWVRRAGPNYQEGLQLMRQTAITTQLPIHIYGPETHITAIVPLALGLANLVDFPEFDDESHTHTNTSIIFKKESNNDYNAATTTAVAPPPLSLPTITNINVGSQQEQQQHYENTNNYVAENTTIKNFTSLTRCVVYGLQHRAVQGMLDFDFMCGRSKPSVAAMIFSFSSNHYVKFYWGTDEILIPVYQSLRELFAKEEKKADDITVCINFSSFRSVYTSVTDTILNHSNQIKTIAIIAEGVPERQTRLLNKLATTHSVGIIGPATVGGIKPGCFRIGNTGGMLDNIVRSKLYRPGSVAYVSKSGGMSNELNNIICRNSDGVYEGVAIGGDRYPGSSFIDHLLRYNDNPAVHILVLLGEVGGTDEYEICDALHTKRITKPLVAWCIGTCASIFPFEVQFGHAGALANATLETAKAKNAALSNAGAHVPPNFQEFGTTIRLLYTDLVSTGHLVPRPEPEVPKVPMDYTWAKRLGLVRKPANFISTISDDRGEELTYNGTTISDVFKNDLGVGGVLSLLWFRRTLPPYATKFIDMILMVTADHGPAVSGAHNTIVAARAGKDLVSSLASGLLTIGPRFGGALDEAASVFTNASDAGIEAKQFVNDMRRQNKLIMGIGHRIKSLSNPDQRVEIIKSYALQHFSDNSVLQFALRVEQITTHKKSNLILNVDGCIAVCFVDMIRSSGAFTNEECNELIESGCLNGLFVLGRSVGFIGHYLDQKRLKQGLYRHPWDDISYLDPSSTT